MSKIVRHIKTGRLYEVVQENIVNATNAQNGHFMTMYRVLNGDGQLYIREYSEFDAKFEKVKEPLT